MKPYQQMDEEERMVEHFDLRQAHEAYCRQGLNLNMARGKPGEEQLAISMRMLDVLNSLSDCTAENGVDCRNYGELGGIVDAKKLFATYSGVSVDEIIVLGSSSLTFMYDCMARAMMTGVLGGSRPWNTQGKVKFLCPVPGYDRHFAICEFLGIEMVNIPMDKNGPDMDMVARLVAEDEQIKGIWCVPKYSNPTGITYSDTVIRRLARLKPKADDFRIFCDNAYAMHYVYRDTRPLNLLHECKKAGNPNMPYIFGSTNKITLPGAGVSFFAASAENTRFTLEQLAYQAISWDKMNMLRQVRFLKDLAGIKAHMNKHANILRPRFDLVIRYLEGELEARDIGHFTRPDGGYFITYYAPAGTASRIVALCRQAGVTLTEAGATYPYHRDPEDRVIRLAPSYPTLAELEQAMQIFCLSARMAALEALGRRAGVGKRKTAPT